MPETTPTVMLRIGSSWITRDERGEVIETVETLADGSPDWSWGGICDARGGGGPEAFALLVLALDAAEANARSIGFDDIEGNALQRLPVELPEPFAGYDANVSQGLPPDGDQG